MTSVSIPSWCRSFSSFVPIKALFKRTPTSIHREKYPFLLSVAISRRLTIRQRSTTKNKKG